jgi:Protein of unknown function (DUF3987)
MSDDQALKIEYGPGKVPGTTDIRVLRGEEVIHSSSVNSSDIEGLRRFIDDLVEKFPAIDRSLLEREIKAVEADITNAACPENREHTENSAHPEAPAWVPTLREKVRTTDRGRNNIGTVLEIDLAERRAYIHWISPEGQEHSDWVDLRHVEPIVAGPRQYGSRNSATSEARHRTKSLRGASARAMPKWIPFPARVLPDPLRAFVQEQSKALGVDPGYVAAPLLAVLAASIGNARILRIKNDWCVHAILWVVLIAESGGMKSPTIRAVMRWLRMEEDRLNRVHQSKMVDFSKKKQAEDAAIKAWKDTVRKSKKDSPADNATLVESAPPRSSAPKRERRIVEDTTVEAIAPILRDSPRGLLLLRDELSGWLDGLNEYKRRGGDTARWNALHEGAELSVDRKGGESPTIHVKRAAVSVCGGIQPGVLARRLTPDALESGLMARCLLTYPPRSVKAWSEHEVDSEVIRDMRRMFEALFTLEMDWDIDGLCPRELLLTPTARERWVSFVNSHGQLGSTLIGEDASWWSKLESAAARIALILGLARDPATKVIDLEDIEAGIAIADWWADEIDRVRSLLGESDLAKERQALLDLISQRGGRISVRELTRSSRPYRKTADATRALESLHADGLGDWVSLESGSKGGRPSRIFVLKPKPVDKTTEPSPDDEPDLDPDAKSEDTGTCAPSNRDETSSPRADDSSTLVDETIDSDHSLAPDDRPQDGIDWEDSAPDANADDGDGPDDNSVRDDRGEDEP